MINFEEHYKLRTNPFRLTPATSPDELIWAGFKDIKNKFEKRIEKSIKIPNSSLVLNWGEYGSGKTHSARYFNKFETLNGIAAKAGKPVPYSMVVSLPKGKEPVYSLYVSVIDKLDIESIRVNFNDISENLNQFIGSIGSNIHIQNILKAIFNQDVPHLDIKKYLYGNIPNTDLKNLNQYGILRVLKEDTDYTAVLAGLFSCLTFNKVKYSCIIIWIDEFEDITVLSSNNIDKTNNFIREILDTTPNNLLIFLNLTQSALLAYEDLSQYLYDSVRSRIKERISFDIPNSIALKNYLSELLSLFRVGVAEEYFPFEENVIDNIIQEQGNASLRQFNETLSLLLELADMDEKTPINMDVFKEYENEIIWNKD